MPLHSRLVRRPEPQWSVRLSPAVLGLMSKSPRCLDSLPAQRHCHKTNLPGLSVTSGTLAVLWVLTWNSCLLGRRKYAWQWHPGKAQAVQNRWVLGAGNSKQDVLWKSRVWLVDPRQGDPAGGRQSGDTGGPENQTCELSLLSPVPDSVYPKVCFVRDTSSCRACHSGEW